MDEPGLQQIAEGIRPDCLPDVDAARQRIEQWQYLAADLAEQIHDLLDTNSPEHDPNAVPYLELVAPTRNSFGVYATIFKGPFHSDITNDYRIGYLIATPTSKASPYLFSGESDLRGLIENAKAGYRPQIAAHDGAVLIPAGKHAKIWIGDEWPVREHSRLVESVPLDKHLEGIEETLRIIQCKLDNPEVQTG